MPFAMTHLYIAYNIIQQTPQIKKPNDFLLGAIAPDSVHFRNNYDSDMKFNSHLCIGNEKWGRVTNNDEWIDNVLRFLKENKDSQNADFIYGYCCHILADIQNNIKVWTPFREKNNLEKGVCSIYHQESYAIDYELYLLPQRKVIWTMLEDATAFDIPDIVRAVEINQMKQSLIKEQFENRESIDISTNEYVTLSVMQKFIDEESKYIKIMLYGE
ncbi:zinc dependent phospholipase C family protein [Vallitalea guaymasensis]|uniref:zinc dependent phospholipase C family protein n=1 Tax=Vallitalea guaymasensis TaxID=1185412 RepID=UPI0023576975|nr:zinc dependent phospholipase C family protein [Vallitalea guaymasensis]